MQGRSHCLFLNLLAVANFRVFCVTSVLPVLIKSELIKYNPEKELIKNDLRVVLLIVWLIELFLVSTLFTDEDDSTQNNHLNADAQEWPKCGIFIYENKPIGEAWYVSYRKVMFSYQ